MNIFTKYAVILLLSLMALVFTAFLANLGMSDEDAYTITIGILCGLLVHNVMD